VWPRIVTNQQHDPICAVEQPGDQIVRACSRKIDDDSGKSSPQNGNRRIDLRAQEVNGPVSLCDGQPWHDGPVKVAVY
jgi:hypothetical protein